MQLVQIIQLTSPAATISITGLPQDATDLFILISGRSTRPDGLIANGWIGFNELATNQNEIAYLGRGSSILVGSGSTEGRFSIRLPGAIATANTFGVAKIYISNYTSSTNKIMSIDSGFTDNSGNSTDTQIAAGTITTTSPITSIQMGHRAVDSASWATGTSVSIYKITSGNAGGITIS